MAELFLYLVPFIIGSAVVPLQVIFIILLLSNPNNGLVKAICLVAGMTVVRLVQWLVFGVVFSVTASESGGKSLLVSTLLLVLGILLLVAAYKKWENEDDPDGPPPKWMVMLDTLTPLKAFAIGAGLVLISGKFWVFTLSAIGVIVGAQLGQPFSTVAYLLFVLLAQSLLLSAILIRVIVPERSKSILQATSAWLNRYNRPIVVGVSLVFGLLFLYQGVSGLLSL